jgi:hypothetical protein
MYSSVAIIIISAKTHPSKANYVSIIQQYETIKSAPPLSFPLTNTSTSMIHKKRHGTTHSTIFPAPLPGSPK